MSSNQSTTGTKYPRLTDEQWRKEVLSLAGFNLDALDVSPFDIYDAMVAQARRTGRTSFTPEPVVTHEERDAQCKGFLRRLAADRAAWVATANDPEARSGIPRCAGRSQRVAPAATGNRRERARCPLSWHERKEQRWTKQNDPHADGPLSEWTSYA